MRQILTGAAFAALFAVGMPGSAAAQIAAPRIYNIPEQDLASALKAFGVSHDGYVLVSKPVLDCFSEGSGRGTRTAAWCVPPSRADRRGRGSGAALC